MPIAAYLGNENLKGENTIIGFTEHQLLEIAKCSEDPIYFINTYVKIIHVDDGLINFNMYPYQEDIVNLYHNNRFVILKLPRQSGKCLLGSVKIRIKRKNSNRIIELPVYLLYAYIKVNLFKNICSQSVMQLKTRINSVYATTKRRYKNMCGLWINLLTPKS